VTPNINDTQDNTICHYAECRDLCIAMHSVVMLNVVAPPQVVAKHWFYCFDHYTSLSWDFSIMKQGVKWKKLSTKPSKMKNELIQAENKYQKYLNKLNQFNHCSDKVDSYAKGMF